MKRSAPVWSFLVLKQLIQRREALSLEDRSESCVGSVTFREVWPIGSPQCRDLCAAPLANLAISITHSVVKTGREVSSCHGSVSSEWGRDCYQRFGRNSNREEITCCGSASFRTSRMLTPYFSRLMLRGVGIAIAARRGRERDTALVSGRRQAQDRLTPGSGSVETETFVCTTKSPSGLNWQRCPKSKR